MQFKLFKVPLSDTHQAEQELNKFLQSHRVLQVERHFCPDANGYWAFCLEYVGNASLDGEPSVSRQAKKNYSKELNEEEFRRFEFFKNVRRQIAQQKALPAYMIFTDAELAVLARVPELSEETADKRFTARKIPQTFLSDSLKQETCRKANLLSGR